MSAIYHKVDVCGYLPEKSPSTFQFFVIDQLLCHTTAAVHVSLHILWSLTRGLTALSIATIAWMFKGLVLQKRNKPNLIFCVSNLTSVISFRYTTA